MNTVETRSRIFHHLRRALATVAVSLTILGATANARAESPARATAAVSNHALTSKTASSPQTLAAAAADDATPPEQASADPWGTRPLAIELNAGFGTPYGAWGVAVDYTPFRYLSLVAGAGINFDDDPQLSAMVRGRYAWPNSAIGAAVGVSGGKYREHDLFPSDFQHHWDVAYWLNTELAYEHRFDFGLTMRSYSGLAINMNPQDRITSLWGMPYSGSVKQSPRGVLYTGMSLGYAFDI